MPPCTFVRLTRNVVCIIMCFAFGVSELARAAASDCAQLDAKAAATILGVPLARAIGNPEHRKVSPDNMDFLSCSYAEATPNSMARTLGYNIFTPIPKDLASVYGGLAGGNAPRQQTFSPNVGTQSSGWFRSSARDDTFEGYVAIQTGAFVAVIKIGGMPSSDAVKNALISAGKTLAKP